MAEADVESDSAILASMAGILSEGEVRTHKQKQINRCDTKRNTKRGPKGKKEKHNMQT